MYLLASLRNKTSILLNPPVCQFQLRIKDMWQKIQITLAYVREQFIFPQVVRSLEAAIPGSHAAKLLLLYLWGMAYVFMTTKPLQKLHPSHLHPTKNKCQWHKGSLNSLIQEHRNHNCTIRDHLCCRQSVGSISKDWREGSRCCACQPSPRTFLLILRDFFKLYFYCMCRNSTEIHRFAHVFLNLTKMNRYPKCPSTACFGVALVLVLSLW